MYKPYLLMTSARWLILMMTWYQVGVRSQSQPGFSKERAKISSQVHLELRNGIGEMEMNHWSET